MPRGNFLPARISEASAALSEVPPVYKLKLLGLNRKITGNHPESPLKKHRGPFTGGGVMLLVKPFKKFPKK